jgi:Rrf2 family iron-sulfur cluster assembly transcriptional regulator
MRLSLQVQYAICGLFDLAYNGRGQPIQVRVIGQRQAIPSRYLEQIFQRLRKADLVTGKRGPRGGYVLARPAAEVTLRDIVEAIEGSAESWFAQGPPESEVSHRPAFLWRQLSERFAGALEETTLEQLCRDAGQAAVPRVEDDSHMYFI